MKNKYDSVLIYAYGGPETMSDVLPFLKSTLGGKVLTPERFAEVFSHYNFFDGCSPMNAYAREFMVLLRTSGLPLPLYYGTLHASPRLKETLRRMFEDGRRYVRVLIPTPFGGYLKAYHEKLAQALAELADELHLLPDALPQLDVIPPFSTHPNFLEAHRQTILDILQTLPPSARQKAVFLFSVHSLPVSLAQNGYESEVRRAFDVLRGWFPQNECRLAWQSASSAPVPWLKPALKEEIGTIQPNLEGKRTIFLIPLGFPFENMEVAYDLDVEAFRDAETAGFLPIRVPTVGTHTEFLTMVRQFAESE